MYIVPSKVRRYEGTFEGNFLPNERMKVRTKQSIKVPSYLRSYLRRYVRTFIIRTKVRRHMHSSKIVFLILRIMHNIILVPYYLFIWSTLIIDIAWLPRFPCHLDQSKFRIIFTPRVRPGTISGSMNQSNFDSNIIRVRYCILLLLLCMYSYMLTDKILSCINIYP